MTAADITLACSSECAADAFLDREWLLTDGFGGFACGTVPGINTRREHGLYVPDLREPKGRHVTVSRLEVALPDLAPRPIFGGYESTTGELATATHEWLEDFRLVDHAPVWHFAGAGRRLAQRLVMGRNPSCACLELTLLEGPALRVRLRPYVAMRRIDEGFGHGVDDCSDVASAFGRCVTSRRNGARCVFGLPTHPRSYLSAPAESPTMLYRTERERGYDHCDAEFTPGCFEFELEPDRPARFIVAAEPVDAPAEWASECLAEHTRRTHQLVDIAPARLCSGQARPLIAAADQFLIRPRGRHTVDHDADADPDQPRSIIAGYPWFADWGRDTMISLPGLALVTERAHEAERILRTYATWVQDGLLPNLFPEGACDGLYGTADATLWYFNAIESHRRATGEWQLVRDLSPILAQILECHIAGTRFGIHADDDGLLAAGAEGHALTWMDAKYQGRVITPRRGKPVEIQALWYNALASMAEWSEALESGSTRWTELAARCRRSFNARFWNSRQQCLYDVVDGEHGDDAACRPNQIFAIALPHPVLEERRFSAVIDCVERELLTPYGLRTLNPGHPEYQPTYGGDLAKRDAAYHQGTVWPWLIGPFVDAWLRAGRDPTQARRMLAPLLEHLEAACLGSVSEVFDAEPPHRPGGCFAQAWSVAELLRALTVVDRRLEESGR
ncbi:MAG TPA: amylo-alpha-1,6-glucosidase [Steroidobacteraceae bacterium]|nr:amylo-alpha-1,6-glucosidase [Steroidobacteraceae bacterium]